MSYKPTLEIVQKNADEVTINLDGTFEVENWGDLQSIVARTNVKNKIVNINCKGLTSLDTFGAWQISALQSKLAKLGKKVNLAHCQKKDFDLIGEIAALEIPKEVLQAYRKAKINPIDALGRQVYGGVGKAYRLISFLGLVISRMGQCIIKPSNFRTRSFIRFIDYTGYRALPIIGLTSLLIGVVLVYQGISQLERFGAEVFTVDLLAISVLRELGILLTAIVVAGRSGSAFTAQIGFMKLHQEIDAMKVMGLDPIHVLVIPRILALMVALPLLTVYCDLVALLGGAFMAMQLIDLSFTQFKTQLLSAISPATFWVGIVKAPVFAFFIAFIGCFEGLRVSGGAESVGRRTTTSVVKSIFMVIVLDAIFSILFSFLKV